MSEQVEGQDAEPSSQDGGYESIDSSMDSEDDFDDSQYGTMARFVPTLVLERLRAVGEAAAVPKKSSSGGLETTAAAAAAATMLDGFNSPKAHELDAAVMVVDVSGFSGMCERFAQGLVPDGGWRQRMKGIPSLNVSTSGSSGVRRSGASHASVITSLYRLSNDKETKGFGAEGVRDALNLALGELISTVEKHGGDVLRIAGDALIVLFHQGGADISHFELADLCLACTRCGWDCAASSVGASGGGAESGVGLSVHVGVGCGRVSCFHVGSDRLGWQLVVSGELFENQVAKALDASGAGEVVVSASVWQHLAGTGWGSGPVQCDPSGGTDGLRLLHWAPDPGGGPGPGCWDDDSDSIDQSGRSGRDGGDGGGRSASQRLARPRDASGSTAPAHGQAGRLSPSGNEGDGASHSHSHSPPPAGAPRPSVARRSSYSGAGRVGPAAAAAAATAAAGGGFGPGLMKGHGRAASLDHAVGVVGGGVTPGGRWCPSRRRVSLLEEVETGVLTMLSKEVGRALRGYCPQPIREGLVAERLGLLAELQRVAVLFVGLSFERVGCSSSNGSKTSSKTRTAPSANSTPATPVRILDGRGSTPPDHGSLPGSIATGVTPAGDHSAEGSVGEGAGVIAERSDAQQLDARGSEGGVTQVSPPVDDEKATEAAAAAAEVAVKAGQPSVVSLELLQGSFSLLQSIVASHGGVIKELSVDDKGTVLVVGFGLSPQVGHLPAARATLCAMECTDRLRTKGLARCHAGVATGPVFCGSLGSEDRREFAMISETVNLAQRLMSARKNRRLLPKAGHQVNRMRSYSSNDVKALSRGQGKSGWKNPSMLAASPGREQGTKNGSKGAGTRKDVGGRKRLASPGEASIIRRETITGSARKDTPKEQRTPRQEKDDVFPLTPVALTPSTSNRKKGENGEGGEGEGTSRDEWQESFNRWVVLEAETLKEARKTDQLAFLELEAIKVKGKTSNVDVFAPSLADDVVAAVAAAAAAERVLARSSSTPTTSPRPGSNLSGTLSARFRTASSSHESSITHSSIGGPPDFAMRVAAPAASPPGVIMGGVGGGGSRIRPAPPLPVIVSELAGDSATTPVVAGVARGPGGTNITKNGSFSLDDSSKRYRLESPRRGDWEGGGGSRGSGSGGARAWDDGELVSSENAGEQNLGADPLPDAAAKGFASWRKTRHLGLSGTPSGVADGALANGMGSISGISPRVTPDARGGAAGMWGGASGEMGGDVLSREAFEALLPCIFHADAVHDEVSHILWARTRGRVSYLADLCKSLIGVTRCGGNGGSSASSGSSTSFGQVGEDGTWRLRLNEFAHVLKLASRVPPGVEGGLQRRLDELPYNARQVVLRVVCVTVVAGVGDTELLLHLLTNVAPFKEYWKAVVAQHESGDTPARRRGSRSRRRVSIPPRRSFTSSPVLASSRIAIAAAATAAATAAALSHREGLTDPEERAAAAAAARAAGAIVGGLSPPRGKSVASAVPAVSPEAVAAVAEVLGDEDKGSATAARGRDVGKYERPGSSNGETDMLTPPRTPPPASPVGSKTRAVCSGSGSGAGEEALRSCLAMLEAGGFLRVCEGGKSFICDDAMLMDQVYASTPFKLRKGLHKEAAQWISDKHRRDFRDRADVMPVLINHLTQAHEEARAQAQLAVLKVLGGRFLDRWVLEHVRPLVSIRVNPRNPSASEHLALCVLPALPSLRGLSKAIRGAEIAGVVVGVALRLRSLRFKDMDKMAKPRQRRSLSISGSSFKTNASDESPRSITNDRNSSLFKRRSASLAGTAVAPCPSELVQPLTSSLSLPLPPAAMNKDGFEIVITGSSYNGIDVADDDGDAGGCGLVRPPGPGAPPLS